MAITPATPQILALNVEQMVAIQRYEAAIAQRYTFSELADIDEESDAFREVMQSILPVFIGDGKELEHGITQLVFIARSIAEVALLKAMGMYNPTIEYKDLNAGLNQDGELVFIDEDEL